MLWLFRLIMHLLSEDSHVNRALGGRIIINIFPVIVLFLVMAISAGMAWG
jgi:hypothetical protein